MMYALVSTGGAHSGIESKNWNFKFIILESWVFQNREVQSSHSQISKTKKYFCDYPGYGIFGCEKHDRHHESFVYNYGVAGFCDFLMGTDYDTCKAKEKKIMEKRIREKEEKEKAKQLAAEKQQTAQENAAKQLEDFNAFRQKAHDKLTLAQEKAEAKRVAAISEGEGKPKTD